MTCCAFLLASIVSLGDAPASTRAASASSLTEQLAVDAEYEFNLPVTTGESIVPATFIPLPIGQDELERSARLLLLSEAQRQYLDFVYRRYLRDCAADWSRLIPDVSVLARPTAVAHADGDIDGEAVELARDYYDAQLELARAIRHRDEILWNELSTFLVEAQRERLLLIRLQRDRTSRCAGEFDISAAAVDLVQFVKELHFDRGASARLDELFIEYDAAVGPLFAAFTRERPAIMKRRHELNSVRQRVSTMEENLRIYHQFQQVHRPGADLQMRLAAANNAFRQRIADLLPPREAAIFEHAYKLAVYRVVYLRAFDVGDLLEDMNGSLADPRLRPAFEEARSQFLESSERICTEMEREFDRWGYQCAIAGDYFDTYTVVMRELRAKRWEACALLLRKLDELTKQGGEERLAELNARVQAKVAALNAAMESGEDDGYPPNQR